MDRISALEELGFEHVGPASPTREEARPDHDHFRVFTARPAMGTVVSVVALHPSGALAEDALEGAFAEMDRLAGIFSRHDSSSPVSQLNQSGRLGDVPPELRQVVGRALDYHRLTDGAFDITVKPLVDLFEDAGRLPSPAEVNEVGDLVGAEHLKLSGRGLHFDRSGMGVTLDGIAKGAVVDAMADALFEHGVESFLINAGGDIRASGVKEDAQPWTVGVRDPEDPEAFADVVRVTGAAVATSGNYQKEYRHLVSTDTGRSPERRRSVSVMAPSAAAADALATALFVMEPAGAGRLARSVSSCESLVRDDQGRTVSSRGWTRARMKVVEHE